MTSKFKLMNVPVEFHKRLKVASANEGMTMAEYLRRVKVSQDQNIVLSKSKKKGGRSFDFSF